MRETGTLDRLNGISDETREEQILEGRVLYRILLDDDDDYEDDEDEELEQEEENDKKNKKSRRWHLF